jgi:hypothetical protein
MTAPACGAQLRHVVVIASTHVVYIGRVHHAPGQLDLAGVLVPA